MNPKNQTNEEIVAQLLVNEKYQYTEAAHAEIFRKNWKSDVIIGCSLGHSGINANNPGTEVKSTLSHLRGVIILCRSVDSWQNHDRQGPSLTA